MGAVMLCRCGSEVACEWCQTMNDIHFNFCKRCGHSAALPRAECLCSRCKPFVVITACVKCRRAVEARVPTWGIFLWAVLCDSCRQPVAI